MQLPAWLASYVGLPYQPGGQSREGVDCWGLLSLVYAEQFGRPLPTYAGQRWMGPQDALAVGQEAPRYAGQFREVPAGSEGLGDGILLRVAGYPIHVGMVVAPGMMLHAFRGADSCIEPYTSWRWAKRIAGIYRYEP